MRKFDQLLGGFNDLYYLVLGYIAWMLAATRRCKYAADSSVLVAGTSVAATSAPSLVRPLSDRGLRLTHSQVTDGGDPVSPCVAGQCR